MYEKVEVCPICGSKEFNNHVICTDYSVSQESFAITSCAQCELLVTNPRPSMGKIGEYYQSEDYISHTNKANNPVNLLFKLARKFTFYSKYKLVNRHAQNKTILDYGCGTGDFLAYCKSHGWNTEGIEPNDQARSIATEQNKNVVLPSIDDLGDQQYSIITLWHVLEHIHDPNALLGKLRKKLDKKGRIIIAVPNVESYDAQVYQQYWAAYDVPRHLFHFKQLNIKELAKKNQLKVKAIAPMKLDSFYVSLLSEKYKTGRTNYIKSFINGWKSNRWAKNNNNNYSSLIYVLGK